jgi:hypothetical protein
VVTAFETALKTTYRHLVRRRLPEQGCRTVHQEAIGTAFQNIDRASREKFSILSIDPFAGLSEKEIELLRTNIEKRHALGHNLGIADEHYAALTGADQPVETVELIGEEIQRFADTCRQLEPHLLDKASIS